jgi:hypothetical protein
MVQIETPPVMRRGYEASFTLQGKSIRQVVFGLMADEPPAWITAAKPAQATQMALSDAFSPCISEGHSSPAYRRISQRFPLSGLPARRLLFLFTDFRF